MNTNYQQDLETLAEELTTLPEDDNLWIEFTGPHNTWIADVERTGENAYQVTYPKRCDYFREPFEYTHTEEVPYPSVLAFLRYHLQKYPVNYDVREKGE